MIDRRAFTEINEVIKLLEEDENIKIPNNFKKVIEHNMNKDYVVVIDDIDNYDFLKDTKKLMSLIYTDYLATEEERQVILAKEEALEREKELEKRKEYSTDLFEKRKKYKTKEFLKNDNIDEKVENLDLVEYKESIFRKILSFIKKILKR